MNKQMQPTIENSILLGDAIALKLKKELKKQSAESIVEDIIQNARGIIYK